MKVNFNQKLIALDGNPCLRKDEEKMVPMTLAWVCTNAMLPINKMDQKQTDVDKLLKSLELARKILNEGTVDINSNQLVAIKNNIVKMYGDLVVALSIELLDKAEKGKDAI